MADKTMASILDVVGVSLTAGAAALLVTLEIQRHSGAAVLSDGMCVAWAAAAAAFVAVWRRASLASTATTGAFGRPYVATPVFDGYVPPPPQQGTQRKLFGGGRRRTSPLTNQHMSSDIIAANYEVRGRIVARALEIQEQLKDPATAASLPFDKVVFCNIGNPQSLGQIPITYMRQVIAACNYPALVEKGNAMLPYDVKERAQAILADTASGSIGAYTHSQGLSIIRADVADFLEKRDGYAADVNSIFLTDGASPGIKTLMQLICNSPKVGIMIPIPQYPLYSASITMCGARQVPYYLREENNWGLDVAEIRTTLQAERRRGTDVRALCVINPGNPTGTSLTQQNIEDLIVVAQEYKLLLLADEVYQANIYDDSLSFVSFRKVLLDMGPAYSDVGLISYHSTSKGILGECGFRGGYMQLTNIPEEGVAQLYKLASISLCPNINGQIMTGLLCRPPSPGDPSYDLYEDESARLLDSLKRRAAKVTAALNAIDGIECQTVQGAMYAYPTIRLPPKAIAAANAQGIPADTMFALELLEKTGVCVVPGSGFGQKEGTFHFRTTILPSEEDLDDVLVRLADYCRDYFARFR